MKKANLISILILSSVLLTSCSDAPISGDDFISKISPNLWDFLAVFAAFIVLILIAFFFEVFAELRQTFIHINRHTENASGVNHGLCCIPQHRVGDDAHRGHEESGDSETDAGHEHADG